MESVIRILDPEMDIASLAMLLILGFPFVFLTLRAKAGHSISLRTIPAYDMIQQLTNQATESGYPVHVGMGGGQVGDVETPEAAMANIVLDYVSRQASDANLSILGTTSSPTLLATAQGTLQEARRTAGYPERYSGSELLFGGPDPLAYAVHASDTMRQQPLQGNILLGHLGIEGLWIAEVAANDMSLGATTDKPIPTQIGGTSDPSAAALMHLALDHSVVGEEVFAAGAYLGHASHLGSLATQDLTRIVVILSVVVGVIMTTLGYWS